VKQWSDDEGWGVLVSSEVAGEVWAHFSHIVDDDDTGFRSLSDGERVRFDYEHYPPGQHGYFWRATWVVGVSDDSEYAVLTDEQIMDRVHQIDERRCAPHDGETYTISETIEVVDARGTDDDPRRTTSAHEELIQVAERQVADAEEAYRLHPSDANQRRIMKAWSAVRRARDARPR
jgi:cold shock protein